ncbi:lytic murein transglycosylase B [Chitinibacteraceae bacterium HSL-7]
MRLIATLLAALAFTPALADDALLARDDVRQYLDEVAKTQQFDRAELNALFARVNPQPGIIKFFDRPSTSAKVKPWYEFRDNFLTSGRIKGGVAFMQQHAADLDKAYQRFGVPPEVVTAIIGVETNYGKMTGKYHVIDVLTTMAFDYPRRADFFRKELTEFLILAREEGEDPTTFTGSYAGAMGWPQFMPSSFRQYAVDLDGDGHRDIWNNPADIIGSVANYLAAHGWERGGPGYQQVSVRDDHQLASIMEKPFEMTRTVADLAALGVNPPKLANPQAIAVPFVLTTAPDTDRVYLGYANFYAVTRYNRSKHYAAAVLDLGQAIRRSASGKW